MCIALFSSFSSSAQNYTKRYEQTSGYTFTLNDAVVMEKFRPTNVYPIIGTVVFQPVTNALGINDLQVNILDDLGNLQASKIYQIDVSNAFIGRDFVPIAAAYNDITQKYVVAGVVETGNLNEYSTWLGLFDNNLNVIDFQYVDIQTNTFSSANLNSNLVTDVCPSYDNPNGFDFILTGVLTDGGMNPAPIGSTGGSATILNKRLFVVGFESSTFFFGSPTEYEFTLNGIPVNKEYFPSRILEIPNSNNTGGYLIAGNTRNETGGQTGYDLSLFYLRLDYNLNVMDAQQREQIVAASSQPLNFFIGDMIYDGAQDEIRIAGSYRNFGSENYGFFADKLVDVTANSNLILFSDTWNNSSQIGILEIPSIPLIGWTKVGRISNQIDERNIITACVLENSAPSTNQTMKLPLLFNFRYNDASMNNWTTAQDMNVFWYKRWASSNGPVHYYSGYDYSSQWYPSHCSFPRNESPAVQSFVLGTYSTNSNVDHLTITQTDLYSQNACSENSSEGIHFLIPLLGNSMTTSVIPVSLTQSLIIILNITANQIDEYECDSQNPFRPNKVDIKIQQSGDVVRISGLEKEVDYTIYSLSGSKIQCGRVMPNNQISVGQLSSGMYLLEVNDSIFKVIK
ncbi:MAG: T9SS type A sorting domain-containing protein [Chitinophagaceae bacterium]|nr:T9SS type A sorting domain-containing protein [Chitinophagaceae bacterium]